MALGRILASLLGLGGNSTPPVEKKSQSLRPEARKPAVVRQKEPPTISDTEIAAVLGEVDPNASLNQTGDEVPLSSQRTSLDIQAFDSATKEIRTTGPGGRVRDASGRSHAVGSDKFITDKTPVDTSAAARALLRQFLDKRRGG